MSSINKPQLKSWRDWLSLFVCGICMGAADIVPGISGGTMAFIMGIYEDLLKSLSSINLTSLNHLFRFRLRAFFSSVGWEFLLALLSGIAFSFITLVHFFDSILNHEIYRTYLYAGFVGLIAASVAFCAKQLPHWQFKHVIAMGLGMVIAFFISGAEPPQLYSEPSYHVYLELKHSHSSQKQLKNYHQETQMLLNVPESVLEAMLAKSLISKETKVFSQRLQKEGVAGDFVEGKLLHRLDLWLVLCGAIAVTALLLPGISGSYMLTILGVYSLAIGALADFLSSIKSRAFDLDAFMVLTSLSIGIIIGGMLFSRVVSWLLDNFHQITIASLTGFMIGAMRSVWPFWTFDHVLLPLKPERGPILKLAAPLLPDIYSSSFWISIAFAISGFTLVFVIEFLAQQRKKSHHTLSTSS